ncbi:MAG: succinyl-diaminopimelate desuccinylase [Candidatus Nanopelagicales bacterium]
MPAPLPALDLTADVVDLVAALVDVPSESLHEHVLADQIEVALQACAHLQVIRDGNTVVARTELGRPQRLVICGHIDTVPAAGNLPHRRETVDGQERIVGLGACDMKGGLAVLLHLAATIPAPAFDVTWVAYEAEEIAEEYNGLNRLAQSRPELLAGDFAVLMEPSDAGVEAGCQGTLRAEIGLTGRRSHSARSWLGENAIHNAGPVLAILAGYQPARVLVDGLEYREGLNAVAIAGGVAGNVIPDQCTVTVNYRYAPSRTPEQAAEHVREVFAGYPVQLLDNSAGALPGLSSPSAQAFLAATGATPRPKYGWTDVARFTSLGIPAVNFGPGDPGLAHTREEYVPTAQVRTTTNVMRTWLSGLS